MVGIKLSQNCEMLPYYDLDQLIYDVKVILVSFI